MKFNLFLAWASSDKAKKFTIVDSHLRLHCLTSTSFPRLTNHAGFRQWQVDLRSDYPTEATINAALHFLVFHAKNNSRYRGANFSILCYFSGGAVQINLILSIASAQMGANRGHNLKLSLCNKAQRRFLASNKYFSKATIKSSIVVSVLQNIGLRAFLAALSAMSSRVLIGSRVHSLSQLVADALSTKNIPCFQLHSQ